MNKNFMYVAPDSQIFRFRNGIKLMTSKKMRMSGHERFVVKNEITVERLFQNKFNIYFMDTQSRWMSANEMTAASFNLTSIDQGINTTVFDFMKKEAAMSIRQNDIDVMNS